MASSAPTTRSTTFTGTAGLIIALVTVAALSGEVSGAVGGRAAGVEVRPSLNERQVVRAVAEAMAQAARDFAGSQRLVAFRAPDLAVIAPGEAHVRAQARREADRAIPSLMIGERMLDLPPPAC